MLCKTTFPVGYPLLMASKKCVGIVGVESFKNEGAPSVGGLV